MRAPGRSLPLASIAVALLLTIMPLPPAAEPVRPFWIALVMIYWNLETRQLASLGGAFAIGLLLDVVAATLLGHHALRLLIINFLVGRFRNRIRFFPPWQQALAVGALLFNDRIVELWIIALLERGWPAWSWWFRGAGGSVRWSACWSGPGCSCCSTRCAAVGER